MFNIGATLSGCLRKIKNGNNSSSSRGNSSSKMFIVQIDLVLIAINGLLQNVEDLGVHTIV